MARPHITVINYYSVYPFNNGGKLAIRDLYNALSEWFNITIVCLTRQDRDCFMSPLQLSNHLNVVTIPLSDMLEELETKIKYEYNANVKCEATYAMSIVRGSHICHELISQIKTITANSSIIISDHVYTYRLASVVADGKIPVWYRAQNVEYDYKSDTWGVYNVPRSAYDDIFSLEKECCQKSDLILPITEKDANRFCELYGIEKEKIINISAGYDASSVLLSLPSMRSPNNKDEISALYISSNAQVAVDAAYNIIKTAHNFSNIVFYIVGSVGSKINIDDLPQNVKILGLVSESKKKELLENCSFALNPITGGSGLNIKMLEYFASGIPVICTEFGARGISVEDGVNCIISDVNALDESIKRFLALDITEQDAIVRNAYELYVNNYTWRNCALKIVDYAKKTLLRNFESIGADTVKLFSFAEGESFVPHGEVYIYGAGDWGKNCLAFLRKCGITPLAFLDKDDRKSGKYIDNVVILQPSDDFIINNDFVIVFALSDGFADAISYMMSKGLVCENIVLAEYGTMLYRLYDGKGYVPYYIDLKKVEAVVKHNESYS